jgi:hypothetical protein
VDVHLADHVANAGDVEFGGLEMVGDEEGDVADELGDGFVTFGGELVEVFDALVDFGKFNRRTARRSVPALIYSGLLL